MINKNVTNLKSFLLQTTDLPCPMICNNAIAQIDYDIVKHSRHIRALKT